MFFIVQHAESDLNPHRRPLVQTLPFSCPFYFELCVCLLLFLPIHRLPFGSCNRRTEHYSHHLAGINCIWGLLCETVINTSCSNHWLQLSLGIFLCFGEGHGLKQQRSASGSVFCSQSSTRSQR